MTGPEFCFSRLALRGGHSCCMSIKRAEMQEARSGTREQSSAMSVRYGTVRFCIHKGCSDNTAHRDTGSPLFVRARDSPELHP